MALHPVPFDPVRRGGVDQLLPQLGILDRLPVGGPPAVLLPAVDPFGDAVADIDAVGIERRPRTAASAPRAPRIAASSSIRLLVVSGSPPEISFSRAPERITAPQPPGPGIALAGAVGEDFDFGHEQRVRPLRGRAGSLNTIRSSTPSTGSSCTSKRSARRSTTSRTSTSGAEAPAVMPSVPDALEPVEDRCRVPRADQPGARAFALGDLDQAQRVGAVRRADHQHRVAAAGDRLDRRLAVRGRVADVLAARRLDRREAALEDGDDLGGVVDRQAWSG